MVPNSYRPLTLYVFFFSEQVVGWDFAAASGVAVVNIHVVFLLGWFHIRICRVMIFLPTKASFTVTEGMLLLGVFILLNCALWKDQLWSKRQKFWKAGMF